MFVRGFAFKAVVAVGLIALVVLPGEAKPEPAHASALPVAVKSTPQSAFGLFLDPHAEPVLYIELPKSPWAL
jgi:hypothetical protein